MPTEDGSKKVTQQLSLEELMAETAAKTKAQAEAVSNAPTIAEALALLGPMPPQSPVLAALAAHPDPNATAHLMDVLRGIVGDPERRGLAVALIDVLRRRGGADDLDAVAALLAPNPEPSAVAKPDPAPPPAKAAPKENCIGPAPSGRAACRGCREKIAKDELRFGMAVTNVFSESGDLAMRWYHLRCAAQKASVVFGPVLDAYAGEVPDRETLKRQCAEGIAKRRGSRTT